MRGRLLDAGMRLCWAGVVSGVTAVFRPTPGTGLGFEECAAQVMWYFWAFL